MTMDGMTINKTLAGILVALLLAKVTAMVAEARFHVEAPEVPAYAVALPESGTSIAEAPTPEAEGPSLAMLLASADADKGARVFAKCTACHGIEAGGPNKIGPNLHNIVGREIGHAPGFAYSDALSSHGGVWTYELLDAWLIDPKTTIPGNKMAFAGLNKPTDRANLIAFLAANSENPPPFVTEEAASEAGN
ncbi:MAG: cytochrome c family protein [Rhodothalassiaceae bacterium]